MAVCTHLIVWLLANTDPHTTASLHRLNQSSLACACRQPVRDAMQPSVENKATVWMLFFTSVPHKKTRSKACNHGDHPHNDTHAVWGRWRRSVCYSLLYNCWLFLRAHCVGLHTDILLSSSGSEDGLTYAIFYWSRPRKYMVVEKQICQLN